MSDRGAAYDNWGELLPEEVLHPQPRLSRMLIRLGAGCLVVAVVIAGGMWWRQSVVKSLAASCSQAVAAQDWEQLEADAKRWRRWAPWKAAPLIYLAEAAYQKGALEHAVHLLDQLPDGDPLTPAAILEQSSILFGSLNRPIRGAEVLERAVRLNPKLVEAHRRLIFFYAFSLQRRKMVDQIYEAIQYDCDVPEVYVYLVAQDWLSFSNAYTETTRWALDNPDEELFLVARAIYRVLTMGLDYSEDPTIEPASADGTPYHQQVIAGYFERFPHNIELLVYHLEMALTKGETDEVARLLSQSPAAAADDNRFWRYKGWVHAARGEFPEAETAFLKALQLNPYDYRSQHQLASVERALQRLDRVEHFSNLSRQGTALRRDILVMDRIDTVPPDILKRIAEYAEAAGDMRVAGKLFLRLKDWAPEWLEPPAENARPRARTSRPEAGPGAESLSRPQREMPLPP
jgi:tetratricopeptide (TPR) repeat protein